MRAYVDILVLVLLVDRFEHVTSSTSPQHWVTNGGDFERSFHKTITIGTSIQRIDVLWSLTVDGPTAFPVKPRVLIYQGVLYYASVSGDLFAINTSSGVILNKLHLDPNVNSTNRNSAVIDEDSGVLFVGFIDFSKLYAVNIRTAGRETILWQRDKACIDDLTFVASSKRLVSRNNCNFRLMAIDTTTGQDVANFGGLNLALAGAWPLFLSVSDGKDLISSSTMNSLSRFNATGNGTMLWNMAIPTTNVATMAHLNNSVIFVNTADQTTAYDAMTQQIIWRSAKTDSGLSCNTSDILSTDGQFVYRACQENLLKYNASNGALIYQTKYKGTFSSPPIILNDVIVGTCYEGVEIFDKSTGNYLNSNLTNPDNCVGFAYFNFTVFGVSRANSITAYKIIS